MSSWVRGYNGKTKTKYTRRYAGLVKDIHTGAVFPYVSRANGKRELFERLAKPFFITTEDGQYRQVVLVKNTFKWEE